MDRGLKATAPTSPGKPPLRNLRRLRDFGEILLQQVERHGQQDYTFFIGKQHYRPSRESRLRTEPSRRA